MTPREIWCNEAQERYVLAIAPADLERFRAICERERCPFAVVGRANAHGRDWSSTMRTSAMRRSTFRSTSSSASRRRCRATSTRDCARAAAARSRRASRSRTPPIACCSFPAVADKTFLVTIGDRTVGGLCSRDPMVGPWQVPVADVAVTLSDFAGLRRRGDGDRRANAARADRRARVGPHGRRRGADEHRRRRHARHLGDVKLSANWMARPASRARTPRCTTRCARSRSTCAFALGLSHSGGQGFDVDAHDVARRRRRQAVTAPVSLIVSAFAPVADARACADAAAAARSAATRRWFTSTFPAVAAASAARRWRRCTASWATIAPDVDDRGAARGVLRARAAAPRRRTCCSPITTSATAACSSRSPRWRSRRGADSKSTFAGCRRAMRSPHCSPKSSARSCRSVRATSNRISAAGARCRNRGYGHRHAGAPADACASAAAMRSCSTSRASICIAHGRRRRTRCSGCATTRARRTRSTRGCAMTAIRASRRHLTFDPHDDPAAPYIARGARPRVAILREQGVNGQVEMAAAFTRAGFDAFDVHMSDLAARPPLACRFSRLRRVRRIFLRRRAGRRRGLGEVDPVQRAAARRVRRVLRTRRHVRARRVQRLPDDEQPARDHSGHAALAALRAQRVRAVRSAFRHARGRCHRRRCSSAAWRAAAFRSRWRTARAMPSFTTPGNSAAAQPLVTLRFVDNRGSATETYPYNPNGSPRGHHRTHDRGRPLHDPDAASGARVPHRADVVASG